jgi:hypothetical protein
LRGMATRLQLLPASRKNNEPNYLMTHGWERNGRAGTPLPAVGHWPGMRPRALVAAGGGLPAMPKAMEGRNGKVLTRNLVHGRSGSRRRPELLCTALCQIHSFSRRFSPAEARRARRKAGEIERGTCSSLCALCSAISERYAFLAKFAERYSK